MGFGNILSKAWRITWNHKILWVFGFLAGLSSRGRLDFNNSMDFSSGGDGSPFPPDIQRQLERPEIIALIIGIAVVLIIIAIVLFILSVIGRGGLIGGVRLADEKNAITFAEAWGLGTAKFLPMLGVQIVLFVAGLLVGGVGAFTALTSVFTFGLALCILGPLLCLLVIAVVLLSIVAHFAQYGIVLENLSVIDSFRRAVALIRANLANVIILGLIMIVITIIADLILVAPFFVALAPAFGAFMANPDAPNFSLIGASGLGILCLLPIAIVLGSILHTWEHAVWTLAYPQFVGKISAPPAAPVTTPYQPA